MDHPTTPDPPEDLPTDIEEALKAHASDEHGLQETIIYAKELLNSLNESVWPIEPAEDEEFVRVNEQEGYTEVVKRPKKGGDAYLYRVYNEPRPDGEEYIHWTLLGRVETEEP